MADFYYYPTPCPPNRLEILLWIRLLYLPILFILSPSLSFGQEWQWAKQIGSSGSYHVNSAGAIAADPAGNTYVVGHFYGTITVGPESLTSSGSSDIFISKHAPDGSVLWAKRAGGTGDEFGKGITLDAAGNVVVVGDFLGEETVFGATSVRGGHIFLAKYDPNGNLIWARNALDTRQGGFAEGIAADLSGNVYLTGFFQGSLLFGNNEFSSKGGTDIFIAKYDAAGSVVWGKTAGGADQDVGTSLSADAKGFVYVTGFFSKAISFGSLALESQGARGLFVAKLDAAGNYLWVKKGGGEGNCQGNGIGVDSYGNSYATGIFSGQISFGPYSFSSRGGADIFLCKYAPDGQLVWAKQVGDAYSIQSKAIAVDAAGNSYIAGGFYGSAYFGPYFISTVQYEDAFVAKFDPEGNAQWAISAGSSREDKALGIAIDAAGGSYVTGYFSGTSSFGSTTLDAGNKQSIFVARLMHPVITLTPGTLDLLSASGFCAGAKVEISFTTAGTFKPGNNFTVQLSDATGSFASPVTIGSGETSPITASIPESTLSGSGFRIRVVSANPGAESRNHLGNLAIHGLPAATVVPSNGRCGNGTLQLRVSGASFGQEYRWYTSLSGGTPIPGEKGATFATPFLTRSSSFFVALVNPLGCEGPRTEVNALVSYPISVEAGAEEGVCISTAPFVLTGFSPVGGVWSGTGVSAAGVFNPAAAGVGTFDLTYTVASGACQVSQTKRVTVEPTIPFPPNQPLTVCQEDVAFSLPNAFPTGGNWSGPGITSSGVFTPALASVGTHTLTYTLQEGVCTSTGTRTVTVSAPPVISAAAGLAECGTGTHLQGFAPYKASFTNGTSGASGFLWEFGDGNTSSDPVPRHTYGQEGEYEVYLTAFYGNGCRVRQRVTGVQVEKAQQLPNVFTPNGDGLNDTFAPRVSCLPVNLKVFNRMGKPVYEQANYQNTWAGENQTAGVYYYLLTSATGQTWKGWVEIIR